MNYFAWNIVFAWNPEIKDIDFDYVEIFSKTWNTVLFIFWETEINSNIELKKFFEEKIGAIKHYDISISSEEDLEVFEWDYGEWVYEVSSLEWESVEYDEVVSRFEEIPEVISVRESWISEKFGNKIVKVDFLY